MANPRFTQKHFQEIANTFCAYRNSLKRQRRNAPDVDDRIALSYNIIGVDGLATKFEDLFAQDNPKFDRKLFQAVVYGKKPTTVLPARKPEPVHLEYCTACQGYHEEDFGGLCSNKATRYIGPIDYKARTGKDAARD